MEFSPSSEASLSSRGLEEDEDREDNSSVEYCKEEGRMEKWWTWKVGKWKKRWIRKEKSKIRRVKERKETRTHLMKNRWTRVVK